jgi:O-antigen/teichoic acid export membrane protein
MYVGTSPTEFFFYQLVLALIEIVVLVLQTYRLLPKIVAGQSARWEWASIRGSLKFSATISFASLVWVLATQADKLVLSKLLSLTEYGYFTLAALISGGVVAIANPISGALLPRLTKLSAEGNETALTALYRGATQLVVVVAAPATLVLAFFSDQILWVWTGDTVLVEKVASVLSLYAVGSGISVIGAFPYYLQYAKGSLRLHLIGSFLFVLVFVPTLFFLITKLGMIGAGATWLAVNLIYFILWVPVVYRSFAPGLYWPWLLRDVVATSVPSIIFAWLISMNVPWPADRVAMGLQFCVICILIFFISAVSSSEVRSILAKRIFRFKGMVN